MNRRDAIKTTSAWLGGALVASSGVLAACERAQPREGAQPPQPETSAVLSPGDQTLIEEIADTMLPTTTASPGAKAAGAGAAINLILSDCYKRADQERVVEGLRQFRVTCQSRRGKDFTALTREDREVLLREIDAEAKRGGDAHYFQLVRELALGAYFSSEIGLTRALRYTLSPGRWEGCLPLKPGQPAWG